VREASTIKEEGEGKIALRYYLNFQSGKSLKGLWAQWKGESVELSLYWGNLNPDLTTAVFNSFIANTRAERWDEPEGKGSQKSQQKRVSMKKERAARHQKKSRRG